MGVDVIIGGHSDNGLWKPVKTPKDGNFNLFNLWSKQVFRVFKSFC